MTSGSFAEEIAYAIGGQKLPGRGYRSCFPSSLSLLFFNFRRFCGLIQKSQVGT